MAGTDIIKMKGNDGKEYTIDLTKEINRGGEARIVPIGFNKVAKVYFDSKACIPEKKIVELSKLPSNLFIKPLVALSGGGMNGFIMEELPVSYFPIYSLYTKTYVSKLQLDKDYKMKLANSLISAVDTAHKNGIVIGDLNPFNIMVNKGLDVKFIDVDSYETASFKHSGKLLEDIRDYLYNGKVSLESDYFSLAIIIFNLFTYLHPYKGNHKLYGNKLKDRMLHKCSVVSKQDRQDIIIPKFYEPITDTALEEEFDDIFDKGERYLIDLSGKQVKSLDFSNCTFTASGLIITSIIRNSNIRRVIASSNYLAVYTDKFITLYNTSSKGMVAMLNAIDISGYPTIDDAPSIFLTDNNIFKMNIEKGCLEIYDFKYKKFEDITGLTFNQERIHLVKQYENILCVITKDGEFYTIYLDECFRNVVKFSVGNCYYKSFHKNMGGIIQKLGNISQIMYNNSVSNKGNRLQFYMFYEPGKEGENLQEVMQHEDIGFYSVWEKGNILKNYMFRIDQYGKMQKALVQDIPQFASFKGFIVTGEDGKLNFINKETLQPLMSFQADGIENYSLAATNAGFLIYNGNEIKLLNTK